MKNLSVQLPKRSTDKDHTVDSILSTLADVCRELNQRHRVVIYAAEKPVDEWNPSDGLSVAWDTEKLRGRDLDSGILYAQITSTGDLEVQEIIKKMREECTGISIQEQ